MKMKYMLRVKLLLTLNPVFYPACNNTFSASSTSLLNDRCTSEIYVEEIFVSSGIFSEIEVEGIRLCFDFGYTSFADFFFLDVGASSRRDTLFWYVLFISDESEARCSASPSVYALETVSGEFL